MSKAILSVMTAVSLALGTWFPPAINAAETGKGQEDSSLPSADLRTMAGQSIEGHPNLRWKYAELLVEWGFKDGAENFAFDGNIESTYTLGALGAAKPIPGDKATTMTGERAWKSPAASGGRRGVVLPVLYTDAVRGPGRTIITVRTSSGSFSFQPTDLATGPILAPEYGFFVRAIPAEQLEPAAQNASKVPPPTGLLSAKVDLADTTEGILGLRGWGSKATPLIYANDWAEPAVIGQNAVVIPADNDLPGDMIGAAKAAVMQDAATIPPRSVAVYPGPDHDIAVGWRSPIAGKVGVRAKVADAHPGGGDGVEWSIVHDAKSGRKILAGGAIDKGGSQTIPSAADTDKGASATIEPGDMLSLIVGVRGSHERDTTSIELTLVEIGGKRRRWDLAKDVVRDIQAGNPHADSLGNPGIWHFYAAARPPRPRAVWEPPVVTFNSKAAGAREYMAELALLKPKTLRQRVRERPEQTWQGAVEALHGKRQWPPFPKIPYEPKMSVEVPDEHLTGLWRIGAWQIMKYRGPDKNGKYRIADHPFDPLGCETDRIIWGLDHIGMHKVARDGMDLWLENQQPNGALLLTWGMENAHQIGGLNIMWVMTEHYRLTGDREWLRKELPRLKASADWILNRRKTTMKETLSQAEKDGIRAGTWSPYGLQPKISMGDGDPSGKRYYYWADAFGYQSVKLLADIVGDVDPKAGAELSAEVEKYRKDFLPVLNESIVLSPVMKTRDGTYRSFIPQGFQDRGPLAVALPEGANIYAHCGPYHADYVVSSAAIEAWIRSGILSVDDVRVEGHFDVLEDLFFWDHPWFRRRKADYKPERDWFDFGWAYQSGWERLPEYYLVKDDVPNFIRSWLNRCAVDINLGNWTFNEHTFFNHNDKSHGNAVFLSNFRNMLVMEIGDALWLARATPRAWLEQGRKISVKNSPTYFGTLAYEIVSDADNGKITATVEVPSRKAPREVVLRFRHPKAAPIKSVTVNGKPRTDFNKDKETITLKDLTGTAVVTAQY